MNEEQIADLINKYESDLSKLKYQEEKIHEILIELRIMKKNNSSSLRVSDNSSILPDFEPEKIVHQRRNIPLKTDEPDTVPNYDYQEKSSDKIKEEKEQLMKLSLQRKGRGRPRKPDEEKSTNKKLLNLSLSGEAKRKRKKGGYQLSTWDQMILDSLESLDAMLSSAEMYTLAEQFAKDNGIKMNDNQIKGKISRSITKLTKRTDGILRYDSPKKGYVYGLYDWFDRKGEPKNQYQKGL